MSFSADVKRELTGLRIKREADAVALLSAFTLSIGSLKLIPSLRQWGIHYVSESSAAVALAAKLAGQYYDVECRLSRVGHERLNAVYNELIICGREAERFMLDTGLMRLNEQGEKLFEPMIPLTVLDTDTKRRAFIRGLFLACGTVTEPQKAYHAEFVFRNAEIADKCAELLLLFGIKPKRTKRKLSEIVYIKDGEQLGDMLALLGASSAMMALTETRIIKRASNEANRSVNCISANLERASKTALRQVDDIRLVIDTMGYDNLPNALKLAAEARLNNYDMSLSELSEELGIGRSAINYRLKKLSEMAEDIRTGAAGGGAGPKENIEQKQTITDKQRNDG